MLERANASFHVIFVLDLRQADTEIMKLPRGILAERERAVAARGLLQEQEFLAQIWKIHE